MTLPNGNKFKALFANSQIDSTGVLEIPSESITIVGDFVDYQPHGKV